MTKHGEITFIRHSFLFCFLFYSTRLPHRDYRSILVYFLSIHKTYIHTLYSFTTCTYMVWLNEERVLVRNKYTYFHLFHRNKKLARPKEKEPFHLSQFKISYNSYKFYWTISPKFYGAAKRFILVGKFIHPIQTSTTVDILRTVQVKF